jgi:hypothetical protein
MVRDEAGMLRLQKMTKQGCFVYGKRQIRAMHESISMRFQARWLSVVWLLLSTVTVQAQPAAKRAGLDWWSLQPVHRPPPPSVRDAAWIREPLDAFVLARLEAQGLRPAPPADRVTLIRRVKFDLLGLPPTPAEIDAFVNDPSTRAYEDLIDRFLASPHYGERWGRHWLDVVRFGESQGYERDKLRDHAWRYRDYVIQSFNDDKPYPQFVKEQIAGDLLEPLTADGIVATGFLVCGPWDEVGATQQGLLMRQRVREEELEDIVSAVSQTFLGLTVNCARCHNHKFDPIPTEDYYRIKAALEGVQNGDRPIDLSESARAREAERHKLEQRVQEIEKEQKALGVSSNKPDEKQERLRKELISLNDQLKALPRPALAYAVSSKDSGPTYVLSRGDVEKKRDIVAAGGLSAIKYPAADFGLKPDAPEKQRRLKLAQWLASPENPLTARVLVNRVWQHHFGRGIVASPNDFGFNGDRPTHPELLDWLASEFTASGSRIKVLHRMILLSSTYRQSSQYNPQAAQVDADNRWLWRFAPQRLEGEVVRDTMLFVSGRLNPRLGGPSFRPFQLTVFNSNFYTLVDADEPDLNCRTVYRMQVNSAKNALLDSLDCPDPSVKAPRRSTTTTPLQALGLMNNSFVLRQARLFAERANKEAGADRHAQVALAYRLALGRRPTAREAERAEKLAADHGLESVCWVLLNASEFLYVR